MPLTPVFWDLEPWSCAAPDSLLIEPFEPLWWIACRPFDPSKAQVGQLEHLAHIVLLTKPGLCGRPSRALTLDNYMTKFIKLRQKMAWKCLAPGIRSETGPRVKGLDCSSCY